MNTGTVITDIERTRARHNVALLGAETDQQLSLRVQEVAPGEGPPLHMHHDQAETFHVMSGTFRFRVGDQEMTAGPGLTVHVPKGTPHSFIYEGLQANGQLISILTPGLHDGFIRNIPQAQACGASNDELAAMAERYGATIIGPGLTPASET